VTEWTEDCCFNYERDNCKGDGCLCACHVQVTIHGKYGHGPMPVEFRDALVEMVRLVKQGIDDGTLGERRRPATTAGGQEG